MESLINRRNLGVTTSVEKQAGLIVEAVRTAQEQRVKAAAEQEAKKPETEEVQCRDCDEFFDRPVNHLNPRWNIICPNCHKAQWEAACEQQRQSRIQSFNAFCPKAYVESIDEKLPAEARYLWPRISEYQYGPKGLIFAGPTGKGKTRLMYRLLRRLQVEDSKNASRFDWHECLAAVMDTDKLKKWLGVMHEAPCLLFDDFGKNKFSERVEAEIFDLVEYRTSRELPLFITTNETPETLKARMSPDRGEPLLRRLFEFCDVLTF